MRNKFIKYNDIQYHNMKIVAYNLKRLRKQKKYSQKTLAEISKVSVVTISNYESGRNYQKHSILRKIALALNILQEEFYKEIKDRNYITINSIQLRYKREDKPFSVMLLNTNDINTENLQIGSIITSAINAKYKVIEILYINLQETTIDLLVEKI